MDLHSPRCQLQRQLQQVMLAISLLPMPLALAINELIFVVYLQGFVRVVHDVPI